MKSLRYLKYLARHKYYVFVAGLKLRVPIHRLIFHDWVKFLPCEWFPYLRFFYGGEKTAEAHAKFHLAFMHHWHAMDHHWQHWVKIQDYNGILETMPMKDVALREMVADWAGAGRAISGRWELAEWYAKNEDVIKLHSDTRHWVAIHVRNLSEAFA